MELKDQIKEQVERISYHKVKAVESTERKAVIIDEGRSITVNFLQDNIEKKIQAVVLGVSWNGRLHEFKLNNATIRNLAEGFGSTNTREWVGGTIFFNLHNDGKFPFVTASVLEKPDRSKETGGYED